MAEITKWFPSSLNSRIIAITDKNKNLNDDKVYRFISSHPSLLPILIISYDMIRVYAPALNTSQSLELMICDEGMRVNRYDDGIQFLSSSIPIEISNNCRLMLSPCPLRSSVKEYGLENSLDIVKYDSDATSCHIWNSDPK
jgi:hypothetical protein